MLLDSLLGGILGAATYDLLLEVRMFSKMLINIESLTNETASASSVKALNSIYCMDLRLLKFSKMMANAVKISYILNRMEVELNPAAKQELKEAVAEARKYKIEFFRVLAAKMKK